MIYVDLAAELKPIIACPYESAYAEYVPREGLRPYIRCFWTNDGSGGGLVIPDLCADIIFDTDLREVFFCGISDAPFVSASNTHSFGIRFYGWTAALFSEDTLRGTCNGCFEIGEKFRRLESELAPRIFDAETTARRIEMSESFLFGELRERRNGLFTQALGEIMERRGACGVGDISRELHISGRQLERVFAEYSGLSPKKTAALVRYQCLWRDILFGREFNAAEKALEYGYADQSHLLNDFRRFHTMSPKQARENALGNDAAERHTNSKNPAPQPMLSANPYRKSNFSPSRAIYFYRQVLRGDTNEHKGTRRRS